MPVDDFGNRADIIAAPLSTVNRSNPARTHEQFIGAAGRDVIKRVRRAYGLPDNEPIEWKTIVDRVNGHTEEFNRGQYEYILGFLKIVSEHVSYRVTKAQYDADDGRWLKDLYHVIEDGNDPKGMFITKTPSGRTRVAEVIRQLINDPKYTPEYSPVTFTLPCGTVVRTKDRVLIGPNYNLALEKTATDGSGTSITRLGHHGTPTRLTNADKYSRPSRETGTKTNGEAENRNISKSVGSAPLADMIDLYSNPELLRKVAHTLTTHETPSNIDEIVDRDVDKIGGARPLSYLNHIHLCAGNGLSRE